MKKNSGTIVMTKNGEMGRTYNSKGLVEGKVPVYIATEFFYVGETKFPKVCKEQAILCDPLSLETIGFID
jgi:hypothetical protein